MNFLLRLLLQFPLLYFFSDGEQHLMTGYEWWITAPIGIAIICLYDLGEYFRNNGDESI
jgi:hypothetical protein